MILSWVRHWGSPRWVTGCLLCLLVVGGGIPDVSGRVWAQPGARRVMVVVDDSGSMKKNDPAHLARLASDLAVHLLTPPRDRVQAYWITSGKKLTRSRRIRSELKRHCRDNARSLKGAMRTARNWFQGRNYPVELLLILTDGAYPLQDWKRDVFDRLPLEPGQRTELIHLLPVDPQLGHATPIELEQQAELVESVRYHPVPLIPGDECSVRARSLIRFLRDIFGRLLRTQTFEPELDANGQFSWTAHPYTIRAFVVGMSQSQRLSLSVITRGNPNAKISKVRTSYTPRHCTTRFIRADGRKRTCPSGSTYDLLRVERPQGGTWSFAAERSEGLFVLDEVGLELEVNPLPSEVNKGSEPVIRAKLLDTRVLGQPRPVRDSNYLKDVEVTILDEGGRVLRTLEFVDGLFQGGLPRSETEREGEWRGRVVAVDSWGQRREQPLKTTIVGVPIDVELSAPSVVKVNKSHFAEVKLRRRAGYEGTIFPPYVTLTFQPKADSGAASGTPGLSIRLLRKTEGAGEPSESTVYRGAFKLNSVGVYQLLTEVTIRGQKATASSTTEAQLGLEFSPVDLGVLKGGETSSVTRLRAKGFSEEPYTVSFELTGNSSADGRMEAQNSAGEWVPLDTYQLKVPAGQEGWDVPLRYQLSTCTPASVLDRVKLKAKVDGNILGDVELKATILTDSWFHCYGGWVVALCGVLSGIFFLYGWIWPARFSSRLGILIVPSLGFFDEDFPSVPLRGRMSRIGWYRHARAYVNDVGNLSFRPKGAVLMITAQPDGRPLLTVLGGQTDMQDPTFEGGWKPHVWLGQQSSAEQQGELSSGVVGGPRHAGPLYIGEVYRYGGGRFYFRLSMS